MPHRLWPVAGEETNARTLWVLDGIPPQNAAALERWLDDVAALTLDEWAALGRLLGWRRRDVDRRAAARAIVDAIVSDRALDVTAWFIRDLVATACHAARSAASTGPRSWRRGVDAAQSAAEWAALAIALSDAAPAEDYRTLCVPFRRAGLTC